VKHPLKKSYLLFFTLLLFCLAPTPLAAQSGEGEEYVIQAGDWLSKLAEKYYGDPLAFPLIVEATNAQAGADQSFAQISNPNIIEVGQKIWIPAAAAMAEHASATADHGDAPHWSYEGETGPEHWGELDAASAACAAGQTQSPIDLNAATSQDLANIAFNYQPSNLNILNNGHTIQVDYDSGSYIELDGVRYDLIQFHFHAPSEHTIQGQAMPLELHLVHRSADEHLAVVGVMLAEGAENPAFQPVWSHLPAQAAPVQTVADLQLQAAEFLPADQTTYRYSGSLTTPPCSEGVNWLVMTTPVELSAEQVAAFTAIYAHNSRPVQPLNERALLLDHSAAQ
jgi:carbonic anhydrase